MTARRMRRWNVSWWIEATGSMVCGECGLVFSPMQGKTSTRGPICPSRCRPVVVVRDPLELLADLHVEEVSP